MTTSTMPGPITTRTVLNLAGAERMKLLANRSFWWCGALTLLTVLGGAAWMVADPATFPGGVVGPEFGDVGFPLVLIIGACAVTGEYRHGTIRATFLAAPSRTAALLAKTGVVAAAAALLGLLVGFGGRAVAALRPDVGLLPGAEAHWRAMAGIAAVYLVTAVFAVAVGILLRNTAGAVAGLLVWMLVGESMVPLVPEVGDQVHRWLPFHNATQFLNGPRPMFDVGLLSGPWGSLACFAGWAAMLLALALVVAHRRDA